MPSFASISYHIFSHSFALFYAPFPPFLLQLCIWKTFVPCMVHCVHLSMYLMSSFGLSGFLSKLTSIFALTIDLYFGSYPYLQFFPDNCTDNSFYLFWIFGPILICFSMFFQPIMFFAIFWCRLYHIAKRFLSISCTIFISHTHTRVWSITL